MQPITVLTIAGSDSGGGAGVQADLRTFSAFGAHGTSAITAITAQNTLEVREVFTLEPDLVEAQVNAVISDFDVKATKTGMLANAEIIERVAELARREALAHLVVDPVLVTTNGHVLLDAAGVRSYREALFPFAEVVTPNLDEACVLCNVDVEDVRDVDDLANLARLILAMGPSNVLVKGGHLARNSDASHVYDVLVNGDGLRVLEAARVNTINDHGTGCSLSSALAVGLGLERSVAEATRDAKSFVLAALEGAASWRLAKGRGPIDHLGWGQ